MIIFGSRSTSTRHTVPIENVDCPHCSHIGMRSQGILSYFHIYWIPMFVFRKTAVLICPYCKYLADRQELSKATVKELKTLVYAGRATWHYNFGLIVFLLLLGMAFSGALISLIEAAVSR
jgi:hypothetical protein